MKRDATILIGYGIFLILMGVMGFLSNPEKAKTALLSGGMFGSLSLVIGWLAARGWSKARMAGFGLAGLLGVAFVWRASVSWMAVGAGDSSKVIAALLISAMLTATVVLVFLLLRGRSGSTAAQA